MAALDRVGVAELRRAARGDALAAASSSAARSPAPWCSRHDVILADEPVASLDPVAARRVMEILKELNARDGLTVVVSLHQVDYALRYCERVVALSAGKIAYDGPAGGLDRTRLVAIYGPEFEDVFWEPRSWEAAPA